METIEIKKGIKLHIIKTDKFKTNYMGFNFHRPLAKEEATVNSLLTNLLPRACKQYPETKKLRRRLEELFGADIYAGVTKKGDIQTISISFEFANEQYLGERQPIFEDVCKLAEQVVFEQESFNPVYLEQEKENLKNQILSLMNDKRQFAQIRLIEEMCKNEPYGLAEYGEIDRLEEIDQAAALEHYKNVLLKSPLDIFVIGAVDGEKVLECVKTMTERLQCTVWDYPETVIIKKVSGIKNVQDKELINQGKLALGFRTGISVRDEEYMALVIYNGIFGGGPYSKLFNNVREKMSLAYYVSSRLDKFKGLMIVNSGIEIDNKQVALDAILEQERAVKQGDFSGDELTAAKLGVANTVRSMGDSRRMMEGFYLDRLISGAKEDIEEYARKVMTVTKEHVVAVAQGVQLDTTYFLTGE